MRCTLLGSLCFFCAVLAASIAVVLFWPNSSCPLGTFRCTLDESGSRGVCLPRRLMCDGRVDCPDGSDENAYNCTDSHGEFSDPFIRAVSVSSGHSQTPANHSCLMAVGDYSPGCICRQPTWLSCSNMSLIAVPQINETRLSRLFLLNNSIAGISSADFQHYDLELLHLGNNKIERIKPGTFNNQPKLKKLHLNGNKLKELSDGTFFGLKRLEWLMLQHNRLANMNMSVLRPLASLWWLDLSHNNMSIQLGNVFPPLESLTELFLQENRIETISNDTVAALINLEIFYFIMFKNETLVRAGARILFSSPLVTDLQHNIIRQIDVNAFATLTRLHFLDLSYNRIEHVADDLFRSLINLTSLRIGYNPIVHLKPEILIPLKSLRSLRLQGIDLPETSVDTFSTMRMLDFVYFENFRYCSYVMHANKCQPSTDGVSSFTDLISHRVHRVFLWIIGVVTILGNALVLGGRNLAKTDNRILAMFVKNLAAADMCIGIYLVCIGERDVSFRGEYNHHAYQWMTSWECTAIRLLAVSTSEVSLLLLTFMSVERFVAISHPFGERTLNFRTAFISTAIIWLVGAALAVIPVLYWNEMGRHHGSNGLCFPLHIHDPSALGWEYSAFLYIGINGSCVFVIVGVYSALFVSIHRTRTATPLAPNEIEIAVRFFFIVFTDCLCWLPTILLKIAALADVYVPADLYAWLVVFILPVNSAINPLLYTFTTPTFRVAVRDLFRRLTVDWTSAVSNSTVQTSRGMRSSVSLRHNDYHSSSLANNHAGNEDDGRPQVDVILLDSGEGALIGTSVKPLWRSGANLTSATSSRAVNQYPTTDSL